MMMITAVTKNLQIHVCFEGIWLQFQLHHWFWEENSNTIFRPEDIEFVRFSCLVEI